MKFKSLAEAIEYFDWNVLIYMPKFQEFTKTREELLNEWIELAQIVIQEQEDTQESDTYDQSNCHQQ